MQKVQRHFFKKSFDWIKAMGFRFYFTLLYRVFSPFPHGTCSLSIFRQYLDLEDGPPIFKQGSTSLILLNNFFYYLKSELTYRTGTFFGNKISV